MIETQVKLEEKIAGAKFNLTLKRWFIWGGIVFFFLNLLGVIGTVIISSFGQEWFSGWLPHGWTTSFYIMAWQN